MITSTVRYPAAKKVEYPDSFLGEIEDSEGEIEECIFLCLPKQDKAICVRSKGSYCIGDEIKFKECSWVICPSGTEVTIKQNLP